MNDPRTRSRFAGDSAHSDLMLSLLSFAVSHDGRAQSTFHPLRSPVTARRVVRGCSGCVRARTELPGLTVPLLLVCLRRFLEISPLIVSCHSPISLSLGMTPDRSRKHHAGLLLCILALACALPLSCRAAEPDPCSPQPALTADFPSAGLVSLNRSEVGYVFRFHHEEARIRGVDVSAASAPPTAVSLWSLQGTLLATATAATGFAFAEPGVTTVKGLLLVLSATFDTSVTARAVACPGTTGTITIVETRVGPATATAPTFPTDVPLTPTEVRPVAIALSPLASYAFCYLQLPSLVEDSGVPMWPSLTPTSTASLVVFFVGLVVMVVQPCTSGILLNCRMDRARKSNCLGSLSNPRSILWHRVLPIGLALCALTLKIVAPALGRWVLADPRPDWRLEFNLSVVEYFFRDAADSASRHWTAGDVESYMWYCPTASTSRQCTKLTASWKAISALVMFGVMSDMACIVVMLLQSQILNGTADLLRMYRWQLAASTFCIAAYDLAWLWCVEMGLKASVVSRCRRVPDADCEPRWGASAWLLLAAFGVDLLRLAYHIRVNVAKITARDHMSAGEADNDEHFAPNAQIQQAEAVAPFAPVSEHAVELMGMQRGQAVPPGGLVPQAELEPGMAPAAAAAPAVPVVVVIRDSPEGAAAAASAMRIQAVQLQPPPSAPAERRKKKQRQQRREGQGAAAPFVATIAQMPSTTGEGSVAQPTIAMLPPLDGPAFAHSAVLSAWFPMHSPPPSSPSHASAVPGDGAGESVSEEGAMEPSACSEVEEKWSADWSQPAAALSHDEHKEPENPGEEGQPHDWSEAPSVANADPVAAVPALIVACPAPASPSNLRFCFACGAGLVLSNALFCALCGARQPPAIGLQDECKEQFSMAPSAPPQPLADAVAHRDDSDGRMEEDGSMPQRRIPKQASDSD